MKINTRKRRLFARASAELERQIKANGVTVEEILADFASWRKNRRKANQKRN